jgi:hypothetical protein
MDEAKRRQSIKTILDEAEEAIDPQKCGLFDYGDLQRIIRRLVRCLRSAEHGHAASEAEHDEVSKCFERTVPMGLLDPPDSPRPVPYH